jgi:hypothetical protein
MAVGPGDCADRLTGTISGDNDGWSVLAAVLCAYDTATDGDA